MTNTEKFTVMKLVAADPLDRNNYIIKEGWVKERIDVEGVGTYYPKAEVYSNTEAEDFILGHMFWHRALQNGTIDSLLKVEFDKSC